MSAGAREMRDPTPEGRIAAAVRLALIRIAQRSPAPAGLLQRPPNPPDYWAIRTEISRDVRLEILEAELLGVTVAPENRARRRDEINREIDRLK